jgi:Tol biopolymer transport system component
LILNGLYRVYIVSLQGEQLEVLETARQPHYTQDGDKLVVNGYNGALDKLRVFDPATKPQPFEIGDPMLAGHSHPAWSPEGTQVIYDDNALGCAGWCVYTRDLNSTSGGGALLSAASGPIVDPNPLHPLWTTGNRFIFRGCNTWEEGGGGNCGIWVMDERGAPIKLTNNPGHIPTDVKGDMVVYGSNETGDWNVYSLNLLTGKSKQLTFNPANDGMATISPDGRWVAFISNREGLAVWYVSLNGGNPTKMFDVPTNNLGNIDDASWFEERLAWGN